MGNGSGQQLLVLEGVGEAEGQGLQLRVAVEQASALELGDHVVDGVPHRLEILEIFVLDPEADRAIGQLFLERLDQLDQRQRVGVEVVDERLTL